MQYQTMILGLLEEHPAYDRLRAEHRLLPLLHRYSAALKAAHLEATEAMQHDRPSLDPTVARSAALETALEEIREQIAAADSLAGS